MSQIFQVVYIALCTLDSMYRLYSDDSMYWPERLWETVHMHF